MSFIAKGERSPKLSSPYQFLSVVVCQGKVTSFYLFIQSIRWPDWLREERKSSAKISMDYTTGMKCWAKETASSNPLSFITHSSGSFTLPFSRSQRWSHFL